MPIRISNIEIDVDEGTIRMQGRIYDGRGPLTAELEMDVTMPYQIGPNSESLKLMVDALRDMLEEECNHRFDEFRQSDNYMGGSRPTIEFNISHIEPFLRRIR